MKKSVIVLATSAAVLATSAASAADVSVKVSGQVNRVVTYADNGTEDDVLFQDNLNTGTRLRWVGQAKISDGLKVGVNIETQLATNSSGGGGAQGLGDPDTDNGQAFDSRKRELWFKGGFGKITLGQGDGAANGTSEIDLSGTWLGDYSGNNLDDAIVFDNGIRNNQVFTNFDGLSRNDRLRYDTPSFGGLGVAVSVGQDRSELGLYYKQKFGGGSKLKAALGYVSNDGGTGAGSSIKQLGLSASYITAGGFNVTGQYGESDVNDADGYYIKVGQKFGANAVSLSYNVVNDLTAIGNEGTRVNLAWVRKVGKGVDIYGSLQTSSLDTIGPDPDDVFQASIGSRIKF